MVMAGQEGRRGLFFWVAAFAVGGGRKNEKERRRKKGGCIYKGEKIITIMLFHLKESCVSFIRKAASHIMKACV